VRDKVPRRFGLPALREISWRASDDDRQFVGNANRYHVAFDLLADAREDRFADTFTSAVELAKDAFDAILMIHVVPFMVDGGAVVSRLVELCLQAPLPILHSMMGTLEHKAQWMAQMEAAGVPMFDNAEDMAHAAGMLARYRAVHAGNGER